MNPCRAVLIATVLLAAAGRLAAEETAPISQGVEERIREGLPDYNHRAAEAARAAAQPPSPDEEIVVLPEMTVIERQQQKMAEEDLYRKGLYDEQLVKKELTEFDRSFLNRFTLPLLGISKEARARAIYLERKNREFRDEVNHVADNLALINPGEAKRLRASLNGWR